jgi:hypothetical protein
MFSDILKDRIFFHPSFLDTTQKTVFQVFLFFKSYFWANLVWHQKKWKSLLGEFSQISLQTKYRAQFINYPSMFLVTH